MISSNNRSLSKKTILNWTLLVNWQKNKPLKHTWPILCATNCKTSWWLNQPLWKNMFVKDHLTRLRGTNTENSAKTTTYKKLLFFPPPKNMKFAPPFWTCLFNDRAYTEGTVPQEVRGSRKEVLSFHHAALASSRIHWSLDHMGDPWTTPKMVVLPHFTPQNDHFLVGKPHGFVGETHRFWKHPYIYRIHWSHQTWIHWSFMILNVGTCSTSPMDPMRMGIDKKGIITPKDKLQVRYMYTEVW